ncbi:hypothetical protein QBC41DRAFT_357699 [Cercophora samala]|uniref:Uncharacterized protein n=1 Tax=Cercophora samala TaxID=330535 RepID=A0AA40D8B6_9PEZI|nr:hypothetical protein QBC41DRAFT_357699 [Cercophora samala]
MDIDDDGLSGIDSRLMSLFAGGSPASNTHSEPTAGIAPAQELTDVDMPDCPPALKPQHPIDFLDSTVICDPFPVIGQTYMLRDPTTGHVLGHHKRRFFLIPPSYSPTESPVIYWRWAFEDIAGDETMLRLKSPWSEGDGTRWILLYARRLDPDGKVVVSVEGEIKRNAASNKVTFKETCAYEGGKKRRDGTMTLVAELQRGNLASDKEGEAIEWELIRVSDH